MWTFFRVKMKKKKYSYRSIETSRWNSIASFSLLGKTKLVIFRTTRTFFFFDLFFQHNKYPAPTQFLCCERTKVKTHYFGTDRDSCVEQKRNFFFFFNSNSSEEDNKKITCSLFSLCVLKALSKSSFEFGIGWEPKAFSSSTKNKRETGSVLLLLQQNYIYI